jgi:hypothetical protein
MCIARTSIAESGDVRIGDTLDVLKNRWEGVSVGDSLDESPGIMGDERIGISINLSIGIPIGRPIS